MLNDLRLIDVSENHFCVEDNEYITITTYMINDCYKYEVNIPDVTIAFDSKDEMVTYVLNVISNVNDLRLIEAAENHFYVEDNEYITITTYMVNGHYKCDVNIADVTRTCSSIKEAKAYALSFF